MPDEGFTGRDPRPIDGARECRTTGGMDIAVVGTLWFFVAMLPIFGLLINFDRTWKTGCTITVWRKNARICLAVFGFVIKTLLSTAITIFWWNDVTVVISNWKLLFTIGTFVFMSAIALMMALGFVYRVGRMFTFVFAVLYLILAGVLAGLYTA